MCHLASVLTIAASVLIAGNTATAADGPATPPPYKVISLGEAAGIYQAWPCTIRLNNGDILCAFYAGYSHVSQPNSDLGFPKGGRIAMVRSSDEGRTWTEPRVLYDDDYDNDDCHLAQLQDGSIICTFYSQFQGPDGITLPPGTGVQAVWSHDNGETWDKEDKTLIPGCFACDPVRQLPDGTCYLSVYRTYNQWPLWENGVCFSTDGAKTWSEPTILFQEPAPHQTSEADILVLNDGIWYTAIRNEAGNMIFATSIDRGKTWSKPHDIGFAGHAPRFTRLSTGEVLLVHRIPNTALHISRDECRTWEGPYELDSVFGAYAYLVELKDGTVLAVYCNNEIGSTPPGVPGKSEIRALRFRVKTDGIEIIPW